MRLLEDILVFSSATFLFIFLPAVYLLNLLFAGLKLIKVQNILLMLASILFYAWGEPVYVILMLVSTAANYALALIYKPDGTLTRRRVLMVAAVALNIGMLAFFKYADFVICNVNSLLSLNIPQPNIPLPIGISFFIFQALSYVLDVFRGEAKARKNYFDVLLYISFFPQLIAGPIVRYNDIAEQIEHRELTLDKTVYGFKRFCFGLAKKILLANILGSITDSLYGFDVLNMPGAWLAALCYILQIYFDFSGYSDMAIGLGAAFGFEFKENFNYPYISTSIQEFWRRWHISLSTWFREYLYIPLGGNRNGKLRTGINKVIVFFFTGLWHGASWNFVIWGLFHGLFIMLESYGVIKPNRLPKFLSYCYAMLVVTVGFVFFRAETLPQAVRVLGEMASFNFDSMICARISALVTPMAAIVFIVGCIAATPFVGIWAKRIIKNEAILEVAKGVCALVLLVLSVLALSTSAYNPFIYFRF